MQQDAEALLRAHDLTKGPLQQLLADKGRTALLDELKQRGLKIGHRQIIANSISRNARAEGAMREPPPPALPVVFIHCGLRPYVEVAVRVTAASHPCYVLGDATMARLGELRRVTFVNIARFRTDPVIAQLKKAYRHASSNLSEYEWFCFERVFVLRRFMQAFSLHRVFHLDSDCLLLRDVSMYPFSHGCCLVNNDFYQEHGFSPLPSASIHAALLSADFCDCFERLYVRMYCRNEVGQELLAWAAEHVGRGGGGGISDMTLYFLLQDRHDRWAERALGLLPTGDLGAIVETASGKATFMNNLCTGEGPAGIAQYRTDPRTRMMVIEKADDGRTVVYDQLQRQPVEVYCVHFSGHAKRFLTFEWLRQNVHLPPGVEVS